MDSPQRVLLVGPLPPPRGGATVSFQTFVDAWKAQVPWPTDVLDISPRRLRVSSRISISDLMRGATIAYKLWREIPRHTVTIVFASDGFYLRFAGFLAYLKRRYGKPFFASVFGSNLHNDLVRTGSWRMARLLDSIKTLDGVIVETSYLERQLRTLGLDRVFIIPGYRRIDWDKLPNRQGNHQDEMRIVFLSQIRRDKGIFVLFEALTSLLQLGYRISCDIYGPIDPSIRAEFFAWCDRIPSTRYCGIAEGDIPRILASYDVMVLPTWYQGEGHPGVIIEAMIAGIPVIASRFKAIPELIEDGVNGFLVEPESSDALARALMGLANNSAQIRRMGEAHRARLHRHDVTRAVDIVRALVTRTGQHRSAQGAV